MNPIDIVKSLTAIKGGAPRIELNAELRPIPAELALNEREKFRKLPFDHLHNFRELGGFKTLNGGQVKWGMIYRADKISDLTEQDQHYIERLKLQKIVDFRSDEERSAAPHSLLPSSSICIEALPISVEAAQVEKVTARLQQEDATAEDIAQLLIEANREMIERFTPIYKQWLQSLLDENNYPQVFHCTAGKDRTGLAAALLLRILGVPNEEVMQDYLATNTFTNTRVEHIVHRINEMTMHQVNEDVVRVLFKVQSRFLNEAYKSIDEHYGDFNNFVEIGLGFGDVECARLRELLLEPAAGI